MAVYRERRRTSPVRLVLLGVGVLIVLGLAAGLLNGNRSAPETPLGRVQSGLRSISEELDTFTIAYPQAEPGQAAGALPAVLRARQIFARIQPDLTALDRPSATTFDTALRDLERDATAKVPAATLVPAAEKLRADLRAWLTARP
ncbi:MAG TPA: hypothetical protein VM536_14735 [Chloroflexia bacterium]|nr:hypothetical protein [Chloroflexia bacterium]